MRKTNIIYGSHGRVIGWANRRMIRDGEGHPAAGAGQNNQQQEAPGNSGGGASESGQQNNAGGEFDPSTFWDGPAANSESAPNPGESAGGGTGGPGTQQNQQQNPQGEFATQLNDQLSKMTFGDPIFNDEIAKQINEGNYSGVQDRLNAMGQQIVRQALAMNVQILRPFAEQMMNQMKSEFQQTFNQRDNTESLERLFPAAKNPVMAKTIGPIYERALQNTKGDREKAVAMTKDMLKFMAGESAKDLGIEVAARGTGDRGGPSQNFNWLDELTGR